MSRPRKILLIVGVVLGVLVVLGIVGNLIPKPAKKTASETSPTITATPSPTPKPSKPATPASHPATKPAPQPKDTCHDPGDIIVWTKVPDLPPSAQRLGGTALGNCTPTMDWLKTASPDGPGYCTLAAWAADNPKYDVEASRPPRPKHVVEQIGDSC